MSAELQELSALAIVALVVAIALWRRWRRRRVGNAACGDCAKPAAKQKEFPLRFHRRR
jgi:hypothetical protein